MRKIRMRPRTGSRMVPRSRIRKCKPRRTTRRSTRRRKRRKYKPKADDGNEDSDSDDDFVQTTPKKIAKAASKLKARTKCGKGVQWVTRFQFDDDDLPFVGSDIDITLKNRVSQA